MTNQPSSQKNPYILSGIIISLALIGFQNCGKMNSSGPGKVDISAEQKPAVAELNNSDSLVLLKTTRDGFGMYAYDINVNTGEVERTIYEVPKNDPSNPPVTLCLDEAKRILLENEIKESSVCFFKHNEDIEKNCTMEYHYPYAIVKDYKLGENASACVDFYDICSENRDNLLQVIQNVLADIDSSTCPN